MSARRGRWAWLASALALTTVIALAVPAVRHAVLAAAGRALVVDEPLEPADIIIVAVDSDGPGVLEAADLIRSGFASRVAVFSDPPDSVDQEFIRRGVPYEDIAERSIRRLRSLGVSAIEQIPQTVTGTENEGDVLPKWLDQHRIHSAIVVSNADHTRRLRRVLRRAMIGHQVRIMVRAARYSHFEPGQWWKSRQGIRTEIIELEKLILDVVRHPMS